MLGLALVPQAAAAGSVTLAWDANSEPDIAGYRLVYGTQPGDDTLEIDVGNRTTFTITDLVESVGTTPAALVVERALYWNANGRRRAAGAAALGSPLRR